MWQVAWRPGTSVAERVQRAGERRLAQDVGMLAVPAPRMLGCNCRALCMLEPAWQDFYSWTIY